MALINCPECSTQVSSSAESCPKCAYPIADSISTGKGRFGEAARAAGLDLSEFEDAWKPKSPHGPDAQVALLLSQKKQTNHVLHLLLSIVTGGLWLIVWLLVADSNKRHNRRIDERVG